jgi:O-antigen/teichoic acid export membrane protein
MSTKKILKNASYLFISDVLVRFISAFATILIARHLKVHDYGMLSVALAFSSIAGYFTDIGLTQTLTREATKKGANLEVLISSFFRTKLVLSILYTATHI